MDMLEQITQDIKGAMKAKDKLALEALRGIKKELLEAKTAKGANSEISEADALKIMQKMVKQRNDAAAIFKEQGRDELAENELSEVEVISRYLPVPLTEAEIEAVVKEVIVKVGATSMQEMGKVMGLATKELAGKADGKVVSDLVRKLLS
jgi:uncharacterized protein YqeY